MTDQGPTPESANSPGIISDRTIAEAALFALIPPGSTVGYPTADGSICVVHDPRGGVLALLSDRSSGPAARRARLIACIPQLIEGCGDDRLNEILTCVESASSDRGVVWGHLDTTPPRP